MGNNDFSGTIPRQMTELTNLTRLCVLARACVIVCHHTSFHLNTLHHVSWHSITHAVVFPRAVVCDSETSHSVKLYALRAQPAASGTSMCLGVIPDLARY